MPAWPVWKITYHLPAQPSPLGKIISHLPSLRPGPGSCRPLVGVTKEWLSRGALLFCFSQILVIVLFWILLHAIIQNFARWYSYNFPEFLEKCRSCVLLNEIIQKFICKMCIIRNNNYTFQLHVAHLVELLFCFF